MTNPWTEALTPRLSGFVAEGLALAGLAHPGIKGRLRELLIQRMIEPYLPPSVVVRTGTIVSFSGPRKHRTQDDIVLFWRERAPLLLDMEQSIMPIVGVLAQIEVKTTLTRDGLKDAVMAAEELRNLATGEAPGGLIFAYKSDNSESSEPARLLEVEKQVGFVARSGQASSAIQIICVADRGTWMLLPNRDREGWWFVPPKDSKHLFAFASVISNTVYKTTMRVGGVGSYLFDPAWLEGPSPECPCVVP